MLRPIYPNVHAKYDTLQVNGGRGGVGPGRRRV